MTAWTAANALVTVALIQILLVPLAGLTGQGIVFIARFVWLDKVTFAPGTRTQASSASAPGELVTETGSGNARSPSA